MISVDLKSQGAHYDNFHVLPIYRAYVSYIPKETLDSGSLDNLEVGMTLDLVAEPDNRFDRRSVAIYRQEIKLGYVPKDDLVLLGKLTRRGIPVVCQLIGIQPDESPRLRLSIEISLLYPPHDTTDELLEEAEEARLDGLAIVAAKPEHKRRLTRDPLSAGHVNKDYYRGEL